VADAPPEVYLLSTPIDVVAAGAPNFPQG